MKNQVRALIGAAVLLLAPVAAGAQSLSYNSGQNVAPAFEGWEEDPDGSKYFVFGYMNRNWEEELDVPVGPANGFAPGAADQGQPTHFLPRRNRFVFRIKVPSTFTVKDELTWTLTTNGKTEKAYASLREDYKIDDVVKASETGALGAGSSSPEVRANKMPVVKLEGAKTRTAKVGETIELVAVVTDDGIPKRRGAGGGAAVRADRPAAAGGAAPAAPAAPTPQQQEGFARLLNRAAMNPPVRITVGKNVGLHLSWFVYRGTAAVEFEPNQVKPWEDTRAGANSPWAPLWSPPPMPADGRIVTRATFKEPGTYVLRALADDGALTGGDNLTVTVTK